MGYNQIMNQTPTPTQQTPVLNESATVSAPFSPITGLMKQAWDMMMQKIGLLVVLGIVYIVASALGVLVIGGTAAYTMFMTGVFDSGFPTSPISVIFIVLILCLIVVYFLIISALYSTAGLLILTDSDKKNLKSYIRQAVPFIIPLSIAGLLVTLFQIGGFFLFVFPVLLMAVGFVFVGYAVICEKMKPYAALKRSYELVSQHFGEVLWRIVVLWILQIVVLYIVPSLFNNGNEGSSGGGIVSMILSYGMGIYASAYLYLLYRETVMRFDSSRKAATFWQPVVAIIGWIIGILALFGLLNMVVQNKENIFNSVEKYIQKNEGNMNRQKSPLNLPKQDEFVPPPGYKQGNEL